MVVPSQTYAHMQNIRAHNLYVFSCSSTWIANIHVNVGSEWGSRSKNIFSRKGGRTKKNLVQFIIFQMQSILTTLFRTNWFHGRVGLWWKGEMYSPPKLGGEPQYTSIGSSYWTDQYSEYFTLPRRCTRHSILYWHQYSWRPAAGEEYRKPQEIITHYCSALILGNNPENIFGEE